MRQTLGTGMMAPLAMADNFHGDYYAGPSGAAMGALMAGQSIGDGFRDWGASKGRRQDEANVQAEKDRMRMEELTQRQAVAQALNPGMVMQSASGMSNRDMDRKMNLPDVGTQTAIYGLQEKKRLQEQERQEQGLASLATHWYLNGGAQTDPDGSKFKEKTGSSRSPFELIPESVINADENRKNRLQIAEDNNNTRKDLASLAAAMKSSGDGGGGGVKFSDLSTTRSAYMRDSGTFIAQRDGFSRVLNGAKEDNAVGDLKIIFGYMKLLDPTSVVREGEFANAENAQGVPDRVRNLYNKVANGERLVPEKRNEFVASSYNEYKGAKANHGNIAKSYKSLADRYQIPTEDVMPDLYSEADSQWEMFNRPKPINQYGKGAQPTGRPPLESFGGK